jgi:TIR domain-containing protein
MSDIFISYKREDQATARKLANALESEGWTVWWDPKLRAGERFNDVIESALNEAKCVIVLWSKHSVQSLYVKDEATHALKRKKLVPVTIQQVELPFRFEELHTPSLFNWDGSKDFSEFRRLVEDISTILGLSSTGATVAEEQHLGEAEERRKVDEERLRKQEQQRAEEAAKLKADDETRRRIEEEKSRAQQEAARAQQAKPQKQRDQGGHTTPHHDSPGPSPSLSSSKARLWVGGSIITIVLVLALVFFRLHRAGPSPEPGPSITSAKSIAEGTTLSGSLVAGQERHFFQFTASSPKTRVIVRKRSKAGFQGAVDVYDQNEKRVAQVREGVTLLPGINPEDQPLTLAFESRPDELYYIMVSVLASKTRGDYEITVRKE